MIFELTLALNAERKHYNDCYFIGCNECEKLEKLTDKELKEIDATMHELQNTIEDIKKGNPQECDSCGRIG